MLPSLRIIATSLLNFVFLCYFPCSFPFPFPYLFSLSLCQALKFNTLFLFIRFTAVLIPASVVSHLSRPFAKQNMYYLLRGTHTSYPLPPPSPGPATPALLCRKRVNSHAPSSHLCGASLFWAIQFGFPFHSNHF